MRILNSTTTPRRHDMRAALGRFAREEDGVMTIFVCFIIMIMVLVGGIGVDLMRNELERSRLQSVSDRAVLAAADLDQPLDATAVVTDYFAKSGMGGYQVLTTPQKSLNYRSVKVETSTDMKTQFMYRMGVDKLVVPAKSIAEERVPKVEISLVLDISGSMRFSNPSRMDMLRPAAINFINQVLKGDAALTTSITIVPYAGQTNPGPFMFNRLNGVRLAAQALDESKGGIPENLSHGTLPAGDKGGKGQLSNTRYVYPNVSSCLDISPTGFSTVGLPSGALYSQTSHFMNWAIASNVMDWGWCPQDQSSIQYMSNNKAVLNALITNMRMHDGTGTHYAMKYAVALLDPSSRDDITALAAAGLASNDFVGRPAEYSDAETAKYIVLMTDGQITEQVRPKVAMHALNPTVELNEGRTGDRKTITSANTNFASFIDQCTLAKNRSPRGIVIYTIAFDAPGTPAQQMRDCASTPSHFYAATGTSISEVFTAIARQINELRLTE